MKPDFNELMDNKIEQASPLVAKYQKLREIINSCSDVVVAYSGGVDSVLLLKVALDCLGRQHVLACIGDSESLPRSELQNALNIAGQMNATVKVVYPQEMANPDYQANPANRCYYCKTELYHLLNQIARELNCQTILCGTNVDDLNDFRPGLQAAKKFNVLSPLEQAGLTKDDIRALSKQLNLPTWNKPAHPCPASRIAYGLEITPARLMQVEKGEAFLRQLGLTELRVRHHDNLVRIEVPPDKIQDLTNQSCRQKIINFFKELGFTYVTIDLQGFRTGSANEVLGDE